MPSRTYIQMWVKLHELGKLPLPVATYRSLKKSALYLDEHPEVIEDVVNYRRKVLSIFERPLYITQIHMVIMEMVYVASLKGEKLHIYPGGRGQSTYARTIFQLACITALGKS